MLQNINMEEIKQYNESLKEQREKASSLKAQIDYRTKELEQLCADLSAELGMEVNKGNIVQIFNDEVNKINSTLQSGKAVLTKIANEGNAVVNNTAQAPVVQTPVQNVQAPVELAVQNVQAPVAPQVTAQAPVAPVQANVAPVAPVIPQSQAVNMTNSAIPSDTVAGSVFGNNTQPQQLPPLFHM